MNLNRIAWRYTLPKFNIAPEKLPSQWESSLPTIIFQGRAVKLPGGTLLNSEFAGILKSSLFSWVCQRKVGMMHHPICKGLFQLDVSKSLLGKWLLKHIYIHLHQSNISCSKLQDNNSPPICAARISREGSCWKSWTLTRHKANMHKQCPYTLHHLL